MTMRTVRGRARAEGGGYGDPDYDGGNGGRCKRRDSNEDGVDLCRYIEVVTHPRRFQSIIELN